MRPYKEIKNITIDKNRLNNVPLSNKEDIDSFVKDFAISLRTDIGQAQLLADISAHNSTYQPIYAQQLTQDMNFNPALTSSEEIETWLTAPQRYAKNLKSLSQYLENAVGQYQKAVHYYADILAFNCDLLPKDVNVDFNTATKEDSDKYKNSYLKACDVLSRIRPRDRFPGMALSVMEDGASFWWIESYNGEVSFLQLPTDFCYITSRWAMGWTGAIDLTYFDRFAYLPNTVPELQDAYAHFITKRKEGLQGKDLAPYQYYPLPVDKTWIFTFDPNKATRVPPLSPTFGSSLDLISYRNLLKDKSKLELWKVLAAKIPLKKNVDQMIMDYGEASDIVGMIQSTLPDNISIFATPFEVSDVTTNQVNTMNDIIKLSNDSFYSSMGTTGNFFGEDNNDSAKAIMLNQEIDFQFVAQALYPQFNNLVNWLITTTIHPYHWSVRFSGNNLTRKDDVASALKLVTTANFPVSILTSACGYLPHEIKGLNKIEELLNIKDNMKPLQSQFQSVGSASGKSTQDVGRPKESDLDLTDEGEATRDSNGVS